MGRIDEIIVNEGASPQAVRFGSPPHVTMSPFQIISTVALTGQLVSSVGV